LGSANQDGQSAFFFQGSHTVCSYRMNPLIKTVQRYAQDTAQLPLTVYLLQQLRCNLYSRFCSRDFPKRGQGPLSICFEICWHQGLISHKPTLQKRL